MTHRRRRAICERLERLRLAIGNGGWGRGNEYISRDRIGGDWNAGDLLPWRDLHPGDRCGAHRVLCGAVPFRANDHRCDPDATKNVLIIAMMVGAVLSLVVGRKRKI